jgi:hypothetical protein
MQQPSLKKVFERIVKLGTSARGQGAIHFTLTARSKAQLQAARRKR